MGERAGRPYRTPAVFEPVVIALIAGHTPSDVELSFIDERLDSIDFSRGYDLVVITVETFAALRAYQIASEFRRRGVKVLLGGFHPTLMPEEAGKFCDALALGEVENIWPAVLADLKKGSLQAVYRGIGSGLQNFKCDRSIYKNKRYLPVNLIETSRGCRFNCNFCSVRSFYRDGVFHRPVSDVIAEIAGLKHRFVFFADDNIVAHPEQARQLFKAVKPLDIWWASQASLTAATDEHFLDEMAKSGCMAVVIGLESINPESLQAMNKGWSASLGKIEKLLDAYRQRHIMVYATFVFGYPHDTVASINETVDFAMAQRLFMANFNMLLPFPGTPVYADLLAQGRMIFPKWWSNHDYRWELPTFTPVGMTPEAMACAISRARKRFSSFPSIFRRAGDLSANLSGPFKALMFLAANWISRRDIIKKTGMHLGFSDCELYEKEDC